MEHPIQFSRSRKGDVSIDTNLTLRFPNIQTSSSSIFRDKTNNREECIALSRDSSPWSNDQYEMMTSGSSERRWLEEPPPPRSMNRIIATIHPDSLITLLTIDLKRLAGEQWRIAWTTKNYREKVVWKRVEEGKSGEISCAYFPFPFLLSFFLSYNRLLFEDKKSGWEEREIWKNISLWYSIGFFSFRFSNKLFCSFVLPI